MTFFDDPLFQAVFNTPVPRIILSANTPGFPVINSNAAAMALTNGDMEKNDLSFQDFLAASFNNEETKSALYRALQQSVSTKSKTTIKLQSNQQLSPEKSTTVQGILVEITPILSKEQLVNHLVADIKTANEELSQRLTNIIENLPAGVCILKGPEFVLEEVNDGMLQLWGRDRSILGRKLLEFMPELIGQAFPSLLESVYNNGIQHIEKDALVELETAGGKKMVYMNYSYTPLRNGRGIVDSILVHAHDVSERTLARLREQQLFEELSVINEELTASNEELEATNNSLSESQQILKESEETIRFMFNAIPQQLWMASADGKPTYANQVMCNNFGVSMDTIMDKGWRQYIHPDDLLHTLDEWHQALQNFEPFSSEIRLRFEDNQYIWHLMSVVPMLEEGHVKFWIGTNTNIKLQKANEEKKDEFLSIASHELKTPLTNIKAFNQLIGRTDDIGRIKEFTHRSAEHIGKLEWLINDLLDVTKINAGKMAYDMQQFDFRNLIVNSINTIQETTSTHHIELIGDAEITYLGDQFRLEQVMQNFLSNAVKYSPNADKVIVKYELDEENILVSIQDFGIGIAQQNFNQLFDRYYRVDNTSMRFEGLGLGLYISSEILKRHKGSFWIESQEGQGSTFYFRLPLDHSQLEHDEINFHEFYKNKNVTIIYNVEQQRLDVTWKGYQDLETVQHGCMKMHEMLSRYQVTNVINDNRDVLGTWSDASDWVGTVWFPMMEKAGLRQFAWIYSAAMFSRLSAKKAAEVGIGNVDIQFFTDMDPAREWLNVLD